MISALGLGALLSTLAPLGCSGGHGEGTAVGNPGSAGSLDVVVSGAPEGVTLDAAEAAVDAVSLGDCEGGARRIEVDAVLDALPGTPDGAPIDGGAWCGLVLSFSDALDPLWLEGDTDGGTRFRVALDPGPLRLSEHVEVDGDALLVVIPLGGALDPGQLEEAGEDVEIEADDPRAEAWASGLSAGASVWVDEDRDAEVGEGDVAAGDEPASAYGQSSGCATGGGAARWAWAAALLALAARARRDPIVL